MKRRTWTEFRQSGLLWWINRTLHLFGWAIVMEESEEGQITDVYPAKVKYRGFIEQVEEEGFESVTRHMADNIEDLIKDATPTEEQ